MEIQKKSPLAAERSLNGDVNLDIPGPHRLQIERMVEGVPHVPQVDLIQTLMVGYI